MNFFRAIELLTKAMVIVLYLMSSGAYSQEPELAILVSKESNQSSLLIERLSQQKFILNVIDVKNGRPIASLKNRVGDARSLIIIGKQAFEYYLDNQLALPALVLYVKNSTFHHLTKAARHRSLVNNTPSYIDKISAIYSDPSPKKQIEIIKKLYPHPAFSVILSPLNYYIEDALKAVATKLGLRIQVLKVDTTVDINRALNTLSPKHALLAIPDRYIYNSNTLKNLIISSYRRGRPIFGFSKTMVKAGAVASFYSDADDLSKQALIALRLINDGQLVRQYSDYGSIQHNQAVARSLNMLSIKTSENN